MMIKYRAKQAGLMMSPARATVNAEDSPHYKRRSAEEAKAMPQEAALALVRAKDATGRRILDKGLAVADGQVIGVRANLNVKKSTGVTVQTLHAGTEAQLNRGTGLYTGEAIGYGAAVTVRDARLSVNQEARAKILLKEENKFPMASVDGRYKAGPPNFDGVELRFNPAKQHLFVDPDGRPVKSVDEATVVGSSVFARGKITYYTQADMPKPARDLPTEVVL